MRITNDQCVTTVIRSSQRDEGSEIKYTEQPVDPVKEGNMEQNGTSEFFCRHIKHDEVEEAYNIVDKEGWNLTLEKFRLLCKKQPRNFYVAVTPDGEVAGTVSYTQTFADEYILGNLVVKETMRKKGLGRKIVQDTLEMFRHKVIHLTAVPGADQFYLNLGFQMSEPQQGHEIRHILVDVKLVDGRVQAMGNAADDISIAPFDKANLEEFIRFDSHMRGYDNTVYASVVAGCTKVLVARRKSNKKFVGYVSAFMKREEIVLDGLFADSDDIATLLFREILNQFPETTKVKLQMFPSNQFLVQFGQVVMSEVYNRYSLGGNPTPVPEAKTYNVSDCDYAL